MNDATKNLAEDSEALKHNLFFRPFFRHRGYYNLVHVTPDQYRKNRLVVDSASHRSWLSEEQLFQKDPQGVEQLSAEGKRLLDTTLTQYGDSIIESPVIVEGYSNDGDLVSRMAISRYRSLLVRSYLVKGFQLVPGNVDSVALARSDPQGSWSLYMEWRLYPCSEGTAIKCFAAACLFPMAAIRPNSGFISMIEPPGILSWGTLR